MKTNLISSLCLLVIAGTLVSACDGRRGTGSSPAVASTSVAGVAAVGAAVSGANIDLHCGHGFSTSATSASDGRWAASVPSSDMPCVVRMTGGTVNGSASTATLYSLVLGQGAMALANVTPMSDLALADAVEAASGMALDSWFAALTDGQIVQAADALAGAVTDLRNALTNAGYTLPSADFDPFKAAIVAGTANDPYDQLLDVYGQALAGAGKGYADAREDYRGGAELPAPPPPAQGGSALPDDKLGVSFDDDAGSQVWLQPEGQGGITAINGNGDGQVIVRMGDATAGGPDGTVSFNQLPNKAGTYACGDAVGDSHLHMMVTFQGISDPRKTYVSYQDAADPAQRTLLEGFHCSVTLTHVGSFTSQYIYGDDYVEGTFTAKLRQESADCAGEGNCSPYKTLTVSNGRFRINKSGIYQAPASGSADDLAARIGAAFAGTYVVNCPADSGTVNHTIKIAVDGSSTVDDVPVADAGHGGTVSVKGRGVASGRNDGTQTYPSFLLQFTDTGAIQTAAYNTVAVASGSPKFCSGVSGSVNPAGYDHATVSAGYARSTTVNCTAHNALGGQVAAATPQGPVTFTLSSDGSYALGSLTLHPSDYKPYAQYEGIDRATFPSFGNDRLISAGNGSIKIALQMDAEDASIGVTFQNGYDSGTCTLPTQP